MRLAGIPHDTPPQASMTVAHVAGWIIPAAMALLPLKMDSREARVLLLAIGLQESGFDARRQMGGGPARGFWEFEEGGGVRGVLDHPATRPLLDPVLEVLKYEPAECYDAIEHNDVLACVFARLLLYANPNPLPSDREGAWAYYAATWRPGRPRPEHWAASYDAALAVEAQT